MANYVLDKGFLVQGSAACVANLFVGYGTVDWSIDLTPTAGGVVAGVVMENIDVAKVTTGKAVADVRVEGIAPVKVGTGGCTRGTFAMTAADGTAVTATATNNIVGVFMETGSAGDIVNVQLTQGGLV